MYVCMCVGRKKPCTSRANCIASSRSNSLIIGTTGAVGGSISFLASSALLRFFVCALDFFLDFLTDESLDELVLLDEVEEEEEEDEEEDEDELEELVVDGLRARFFFFSTFAFSERTMGKSVLGTTAT